jgi:BolA family transcriptional regulator, general stress-responsive regulator
MTSAATPSQVSVSDIETALRAALAPAHLEVINESHLHAGHAGAGEGSHFRVVIRSSRFAGVPRVGRHRLVYDALSDQIARGIHALVIVAETA